MKRTSAVLAGISGAFLAAGFAISWRDGHRFVIRRYRVFSPKIRKKTTLVFLTDLHSQTYGKRNDPEGPNGPILRAVRRIRPDAVVIGGDMIVAKDASFDRPGWMEVPLDLAGVLAEEFPVYLAEGNHEAQLACARHEGRYLRQYLEYGRAMDHLGVHRLHNQYTDLSIKEEGKAPPWRAPKNSCGIHEKQSAEAGAEERADTGIRLYGLDLNCEAYRKFWPYRLCREQVEEKIGKPDPDRFCVVLAHNPKFFPVYAEWGADLVLSGHIHGGIVRLGPNGPGLLSPDWHFFPEYTGGEYRAGKEDGTEASMVLSCGTGTHSLHLRFMNPGEIAVVELDGCD